MHGVPELYVGEGPYLYVIVVAEPFPLTDEVKVTLVVEIELTPWAVMLGPVAQADVVPVTTFESADAPDALLARTEYAYVLPQVIVALCT